MDSKRKKTVGGASVEELDDRATKRRRLPDGGGGETAEITAKHGLNLIEQVKNMKDRSGRYYADDFLQLPSKKELPIYYETIPMPIAISSIEAKLKRREISTLTALESLFHRMVANAKTFNEEGSGIVLDADRILKKVTDFMKKENPAYKNADYTPHPTPLPGVRLVHRSPSRDIEGDGEAVQTEGDVNSTPSGVTIKVGRRKPVRPLKEADVVSPIPNTDKSNGKRETSSTPIHSEPVISDTDFSGLTFQQAQERILLELMGYKDQEDHVMAKFEVFMNLPPRSLKDYYQVIKDPVSLKGIQKRVKGIHGRNDPVTGVSDFKSWAGFGEEVAMIWKNAQHYNEDGSDIHALAEALKTFFTKLLDKVRGTVVEPSTGTKLKIKLPPAAEPAPKIKLRVGSSARLSSADSPAPTTEMAGQAKPVASNEVTTAESPAKLPASEVLVRARSASRPVASPAPSHAVLATQEEKVQTAPIVPTNVPSNDVGSLSLPTPSAVTNGDSNPMLPPGTSGAALQATNGIVQTQPILPPSEPPKFYNQRFRPPGKTAADALISNVSVQTHPGLTIYGHFRIDFPPSNELCQQSLTLTVPRSHFMLQIKPTVASFIVEGDFQHRIFVTCGTQRLHPLPTIPGGPIDLVKPGFEARLAPGVNIITIELVAALPKKDSKELDAFLEKVTIYAHLLK